MAGRPRGWRVRYEPAATVLHEHRTTTLAWMSARPSTARGVPPRSTSSRASRPPSSPRGASASSSLRRPAALVGARRCAAVPRYGGADRAQGEKQRSSLPDRRRADCLQSRHGHRAGNGPVAPALVAGRPRARPVLEETSQSHRRRSPDERYDRIRAHEAAPRSIPLRARWHSTTSPMERVSGSPRYAADLSGPCCPTFAAFGALNDDAPPGAPGGHRQGESIRSRAPSPRRDILGGERREAARRRRIVREDRRRVRLQTVHGRP